MPNRIDLYGTQKLINKNNNVFFPRLTNGIFSWIIYMLIKGKKKLLSSDSRTLVFAINFSFSFFFSSVDSLTHIHKVFDQGVETIIFLHVSCEKCLFNEENQLPNHMRIFLIIMFWNMRLVKQIYVSTFCYKHVSSFLFLSSL
jgi:hypothetical protein